MLKLLKIFKLLGKIAIGFVCFVIVYGILSLLISKIEVDKEIAENQNIAIYILSNGVHTDLVLPTKNSFKDWTTDIKYSDTKSADSTYKYLAFGWGDKGFYLETPEWKDLKTSVAVAAATGLGTTAVHTNFLKKIVENELCKKIILNKEQYLKLVQYIDNTFKKDAYAKVTHIQTTANYNNNDAFYEANGSYSVLKTCNTWANDGLKVSGQKCCLWTPFDFSILEKHN